MDEFRIRRFKNEDIPSLIALFRQTVHTVGQSLYTQEQLDAWAPPQIDQAQWQLRLGSCYTILIEQTDQILGFASLTDDGCVDMFYVSAFMQGQGLGAKLYKALEEEARSRGLKVLHSDVSLTARSFFLSRGFKIEKEYRKSRQGVEFLNAIMIKSLND